MKRVVPVVLSTLLLGGCALPVHVQVISWALDGVSYLMTEKSVTDHGLSMVTQQDCALWRIVTEGEVCRDEDAITIIASADETTVNQDNSPEIAPAVHAPISWTNPATADELSVMEVAVVALDAPVIDTLPPRKPGQETTATATTTMVAASDPVLVRYDDVTGAGDYLVIGSFSQQSNAKGFAKSNGSFDTKILPAVVSGSKMYRVVVGPLADDNRDAITSSLQVAGVLEIWPLSVPQALTTIAWRPVEKAPVYDPDRTLLASLSNVPE